MVGIKHSVTKASGERGYANEWNADHVVNGNVDYNQYQNTDFVIENRTDFPAGPVEGQVIFRTDQNKFYVWNGTEWVTFVSPATIVVAADGSGHTTSIQEGINMLPAGGGVVYIKEGTYTIITPINLPKSNISIKGAGYSTQIRCTQNIFVIDFNDKDRITIEDIYFYKTITGNTPILYISNGCDNCTIRGCWLEGGYEALFIENSNIDVFNSFFINNYSGIYTSNMNYAKITNNYFTGTSYACIDFNASNKNVIMGNVVNNGGTVGIYIKNSDYNLINSNYVGGCDYGINLNATADYNIVNSNNIRDNTTPLTNNGSNNITEHNQV